ncbi:MAG: hypothetical protein ACYC5A_07105 [Thermoleophilia bacterium]
MIYMGKSQQASIIGFIIIFAGVFLPAIQGTHSRPGLIIASKLALILIGLALIAVLFSLRERFGLQVFFSLLTLAHLAFMYFGLDTVAGSHGTTAAQVIVPWGWLVVAAGIFVIFAAPVLDNY